MNPRSPKRLAYILVFIIVLGLLWLGWQSMQHNKDGRLELEIVPGDATVKITGGPTVRQGTVYLPPQAYELVVSRQGFSTITVITKVQLHKTTTERIALKANGRIGEQWFKDHPDEARRADSINNQNGTVAAQQTLNTYGLLKSLPYYGPGAEYKIDYRVGAGSSKPTILITLPTPDNEQFALDWIHQQGYDPADYTIQLIQGQPY